jgi:hypothetical protein
METPVAACSHIFANTPMPLFHLVHPSTAHADAQS